jgi:hypothetical protein
VQATRVTLTDALRGQVSGGVQSSTLRRILTSQVAVSPILLIVLRRSSERKRDSSDRFGLETDGVIRSGRAAATARSLMHAR